MSRQLKSDMGLHGVIRGPSFKNKLLWALIPSGAGDWKGKERKKSDTYLIDQQSNAFEGTDSNMAQHRQHDRIHRGRDLNSVMKWQGNYWSDL
jgi:hypothetical protein